MTSKVCIIRMNETATEDLSRRHGRNDASGNSYMEFLRYWTFKAFSKSQHLIVVNAY